MCSCGRSTEYTNFRSDVEGEILIFFLPTENLRCVYGELARQPDRDEIKFTVYWMTSVRRNTTTDCIETLQVGLLSFCYKSGD